MTPAQQQDRSEETGWSRRLEPLGVATIVTASNPALLAAFCQAYAEWQVDREEGAPVILLRLELVDGSYAQGAIDIRVDASRLTLTGQGIAGHADARARRAHCVVPPRFLDDPAALAEITDTLLLFLLARSDRTPLHAAGVMLGQRALVLAGPSGSGKSTLALAAAGRGLQILSDDTLYIQLRPRTRIWGLRRPVHVFPEDAPRFTRATRLRGGKLKAAVPLPPQAVGPAFADTAELILLERGDRLDLSRLDPQSAIARLARLDPGFDLLPRESAAAARALAHRGAWRLMLADDPGAAIDFLRARLPADVPAG
jgi:hypothetical protein